MQNQQDELHSLRIEEARLRIRNLQREFEREEELHELKKKQLIELHNKNMNMK